MTECNQCGACCTMIVAPTTTEIRRELADGEVPTDRVADVTANVEFMEKHWQPYGALLNRNVYRCNRYDEETHLCMAHDDRPPACRAFPGMGRELTAGDLHWFPNCEFWADVPSEDRPPGWAPVLLTTKPRP